LHPFGINRAQAAYCGNPKLLSVNH